MQVVLLLHCQDKPGIVASIANFVAKRGGNVIDASQHVDHEADILFMRVAWEYSGEKSLFPSEKKILRQEFNQAVAIPFEMQFDIHFSDEVRNMAVMVSKEAHCLHDILARYQNNEWPVNISCLISNHAIWEDEALRHGIPFYHCPIAGDDKVQQEQTLKDILTEHSVELIVLARYMQILSDKFVSTYNQKIINIHHSFLPAFPGGKPYHQAYERGVKLIGATSHYVTADLDAGPIIAQNVASVSHRDSVEELIRKGRDLEKTVLSEAIRLHLGHRILAYNNKTVCF